MNCLYITLFFNTVAGIVQTFIKSWKQLRYPRVIEVCRLPFEPRHDFFLHLIIVVELFPSEMFQLQSQLRAHVPYCYLWPVFLYHIFPRNLINGTIFEKKSIEHKKVFWFSLQLLSETFLILSKIQLDMIVNVSTSNVKDLYSRHILTKLWFPQPIF